MLVLVDVFEGVYVEVYTCTCTLVAKGQVCPFRNVCMLSSLEFKTAGSSFNDWLTLVQVLAFKVAYYPPRSNGRVSLGLSEGFGSVATASAVDVPFPLIFFDIFHV